MSALQDIIGFLDRELRTGSIQDYPGALNGLQLENSGAVTRIVAAVDASSEVIRTAAAGGNGLLLVHHGMFWQGATPIIGAGYRKLKHALDADLAIYSSHLPLDIHPEWGNNILLAKALGLRNPVPFFPCKDFQLGIRGEWAGTRDRLAEVLREILGGPVHLCPAGPSRISELGIITGGAGSEVAKMAGIGLRTFVTGEGPHWSYPMAEEHEMNLFYGGHYATETFGVRKLAEVLSERWEIPWEFIDHPTGL